MRFKNRSKSILAGGIIGLTFLITLGFFSFDVELEYSEVAAEVEPAAEVELTDFEVTKTYLDMNCNPEIDTDGDNVPDNLDVEGPVDWSYCNLRGLNLSNLELSGANLLGADLYGANLSNTNLSGANISYAQIYKVNLSNTNLTYANLSYSNLCGASLD